MAARPDFSRQPRRAALVPRPLLGKRALSAKKTNKPLVHPIPPANAGAENGEEAPKPLMRYALMNQQDINLAALLLTEHYGTDAQRHAAQNAQALLARGEIEASNNWKRVLQAIQDLASSGTRG